MSDPDRTMFAFSAVQHEPRLSDLDPTARWTWLGVLHIASTSPQPGHLFRPDGTPIDRTDVARVTGVPDPLPALRTFLERGLLRRVNGHVMVGDWTSWTPSDTSYGTKGKGEPTEGDRPSIDPPTPVIPLRKSQGSLPASSSERDGDVGREAALVVQQPTGGKAVTYTERAGVVPKPKKRGKPQRERTLERILGRDYKGRVVEFPSQHHAVTDALGLAFGACSDADWVRCAKAASLLLKAQPPVTREEVPVLVKNWPVVFPGATCTETAIAKWIGKLRQGRGPEGSRNGRESAREQIRRVLGDG